MKFKLMSKYCILLLIVVITFVSCDKREQNIAFAPGISDNLATIASKETNLTVFVAAVKRTELDADIALLGNYTIFAPTDAAFASAGITSATVATLPIDLLRSVLRNHIISGRILSTDLLPGPNAPYTNINRQILNSSFYAGSSFLNGKKISKVNTLALNGVIHQIDGVLLPPLSNSFTAAPFSPPTLSSKFDLARAVPMAAKSIPNLGLENDPVILSGIPKPAKESKSAPSWPLRDLTMVGLAK